MGLSHERKFSFVWQLLLCLYLVMKARHVGKTARSASVIKKSRTITLCHRESYCTVFTFALVCRVDKAEFCHISREKILGNFPFG